MKDFVDALCSSAPAKDRRDALSLYGWLVGEWDLEGVVHSDTGEERRVRGEVHASWALEGRAIQDVWSVPDLFYGTTLRVFDPDLDAWHIIWSDPLRQVYVRQIGRKKGDRIVQEGVTLAGAPQRWSFNDIKPESFRWIGERGEEPGSAWRVRADFRLRRRQGQDGAAKHV